MKTEGFCHYKAVEAAQNGVPQEWLLQDGAAGWLSWLLLSSASHGGRFIAFFFFNAFLQ